MRHKNVNWNLSEGPLDLASVQVAVLMDIRDELKDINRIIGCHNFIEIPMILRGVRQYCSRLPAAERKQLRTQKTRKRRHVRGLKK